MREMESVRRKQSRKCVSSDKQRVSETEGVRVRKMRKERKNEERKKERARERERKRERERESE